MFYDNKKCVLFLLKDRIYQTGLFQLIFCCIEAFAYVVIYRIRKIVKHPHYIWISGKSLLIEVFYLHITWKLSWALYLYSIIKYPDMDVVI
ncbi:hypothetical protein BC360_24770 [Ensifer sp. LC163]|nr:hypothetical protein BC360_24770 [Ensifer sp. LC163]